MIVTLVVCLIALATAGIICYWMDDSSKPQKPQP
jgi:hypothetical protein